MKNIFNLWLSFSKKELNGLLILALICITCIGFNFFKDYFFEEPAIDFSAFHKEVADFERSFAVKDSKSGSVKLASSIQLKPFNPNTTSLAEWLSFGLSERQAKVLLNYINKGGRFKKKEDLKKIYSITFDDYNRLEPYILIADQPQNKSHAFRKRNSPQAKPKNSLSIEINSADSAKLVELKGIGPAFASRIIKYRNRLGGFYSKEQIREVYGIDSLLYTSIQNYIKVDPSLITQVNLNQASFNELKRYPYWSFKQINTLLNYRKHHGNFTTLTDIQQAIEIDQSSLNKLSSYLRFN